MKNCELCGIEYSEKMPHQKFCSRSCSKEHHKARYSAEAVSCVGHKNEARQCVQCKRDFQWTSSTTHKKFCSSDCRTAWWRRKGPAERKSEVRSCIQCGADFQWSSSNPSKKNCSKECSAIYSRENHPLRAARKEETRQCVQCERDFQWTSSRPNKKFCSKECGNEHHRPKSKKPKEVKIDIAVKYDQCHIKDKHYVYGWYDGDLLFYVGKGIGDRHKIRHKRNDGTDAWCETAKQNAKNFRCLMLKTGLTERESRIVESTLITVCRPYTNVAKKKHLAMPAKKTCQCLRNKLN